MWRMDAAGETGCNNRSAGPPQDDTGASPRSFILHQINLLRAMLVENVLDSIRFYQSLGFHVAATEMDAAGQPLWALLRRDDADVFVMARSTWSHGAVPLPERAAPMTLVLGEGTAPAQLDPDGVAVHTDLEPYRRAA